MAKAPTTNPNTENQPERPDVKGTGRNLKAKSAAARAALAQTITAKYDKIMPRLTRLMEESADTTGDEHFNLPETDRDFDDWSSASGIAYLADAGLTAARKQGDKVVLQIAWSDAQ